MFLSNGSQFGVFKFYRLRKRFETLKVFILDVFSGIFLKFWRTKTHTLSLVRRQGLGKFDNLMDYCFDFKVAMLR